MRRQEFIHECLREHNKCRKLHGVDELRYSHDLDSSAQGWADVLVHKDHLMNSPTANSGAVGESISTRSGSGKKVTLTGTEVTNQWYGDVSKYDFELNEGGAGNLTQLIWKSTEEVGFGIAHIKGKCVVVAHYRPAGNVMGQYKSNVFPLVSNNENCPKICVQMAENCPQESNQENILCETREVCSDGWSDELCFYKTPAFHIRTESMSSDDNFERELYGYSDLHQAQSRQLRQFIRDTIKGINKYRVLHGVPIVRHNKILDEMCQKWANELSTRNCMSNSGNTYNGKKVGENIASRWSNQKCDYTAEELVEHWYAEGKLHYFDHEPINVNGIGNFTQMVWKSTEEVGIGKAFSSQDADYQVVIVVNFYPAGNVLHKFKANVFPDA